MALPDAPADRYLAVSDTFGSLVDGCTSWSAPSPVGGWAAQDVVWHLVDWIPDVLQTGCGIELPRRRVGSADPAADWTLFDSSMRQVLEDSTCLAGAFRHPMAGSMSVEAAIDMLVTPDVFMHSWDLARATGQDIVLDPDYSTALLAGLEEVEELLRGSGHYGPRVAVDADADAGTRLIAFIGRDPHWAA